eukprot:CAMPEP_0168298854 /NCGR_PEP_ID=MMETSP0142_2-20121227/24212_1 /TAXON_ID=44445 /ORGANISM="Pseudo-nitzschia australis, Strain 10249 10 AB" /LENGTH=36 /DNA_ID= /DNA_START= /DNA_END= /DNA_ORIENTATION=
MLDKEHDNNNNNQWMVDDCTPDMVDQGRCQGIPPVL